jgi:SAM-dependent methyltransferase
MPSDSSIGEGRIPGTKGYAQEAEELIGYYEGIPFADKHRAALHLFPAQPSRVLDIGAGTGADAAWFADKGHRVVAVEPTKELRLPGMALHRSSSIEWLDDSLPDLTATLQRKEEFDVIMMTDVWMHLDEAERQVAMPRVASLLTAKGVLVMTLRHGPVPPGRRMFEVTAEETIALAQTHGLRAILGTRAASVQAINRQAGVTWSCVALARAAP